MYQSENPRRYSAKEFADRAGDCPIKVWNLFYNDKGDSITVVALTRWTTESGIACANQDRIALRTCVNDPGSWGTLATIEKNSQIGSVWTGAYFNDIGHSLAVLPGKRICCWGLNRRLFLDGFDVETGAPEPMKNKCFDIGGMIAWLVLGLPAFFLWLFTCCCCFLAHRYIEVDIPFEQIQVIAAKVVKKKKQELEQQQEEEKGKKKADEESGSLDTPLLVD